MGYSVAQTYLIAQTSLYVLLILPLGIIWFVSFFTVRRRADPARIPFVYMKIVYPLITLALILYVSSNIVYIVELNVSSDYYSHSTISTYTLIEILDRLLDVGVLLEDVGTVFLLFCMVELGLSFLFVLNRSRPGHNVIRAVAGSLGVVVLAIAIGRFARLEAFFTDYFAAIMGGSGKAAPNVSILFTLRKLGAASHILLWVASLGVLALSIFVLVVSQQKTQPRHNAAVFFVVGILDVLRNTWKLAFDATWVLQSNTVYNPPLYTRIINAVLNIWVTFVILAMIFSIGCRERDGLWTTQQPWTGEGEPPTQQTWPVPTYPVMQQGPPQYLPQAMPAHQMQPAWQQQPVHHYHPQASLIEIDSPHRAMPQQHSPPPQSPAELANQRHYEMDAMYIVKTDPYTRTVGS